MSQKFEFVLDKFLHLIDIHVLSFELIVFDLFHAGHVEALQRAKAQGDVLLVGVLSDESAANYKRVPIIPYAERFAIIESIAIVDEIIPGPQYETRQFYIDHNIDIHCQGDQLEGFYEVANSLGILRILGRSKITETSQIIERVSKRKNL